MGPRPPLTPFITCNTLLRAKGVTSGRSIVITMRAKPHPVAGQQDQGSMSALVVSETLPEGEVYA